MLYTLFTQVDQALADGIEEMLEQEDELPPTAVPVAPPPRTVPIFGSPVPQMRKSPELVME